MRIKLNANLHGKKKGDIVEVETDASGVPVSSYWYRRLKDAEIDNCIEIVSEDSTKSEGKFKKKKQEIKNDDSSVQSDS